jgi:hypothetical protein
MLRDLSMSYKEKEKEKTTKKKFFINNIDLTVAER